MTPDRPPTKLVWTLAIAFLLVGSVVSWILWPASVAEFPSFGVRTQADIVRQDLQNLKQGIKLFRMQERRLPTTLAELYGADAVMDGSGPPVDPWGNDYVYERTRDRTYDLGSHGPDGQPGGDDDLTLDDIVRTKNE